MDSNSENKPEPQTQPTDSPAPEPSLATETPIAPCVAELPGANPSEPEPSAGPSAPEEASSPAMPPMVWQPRILFLLLLGGFFLRLAYVHQIDTPPFSDMADYETMALNFIDGKGLIMSDLYKAYRPPLYPLWIALIYKTFGLNPLHVYLSQCILSILSVVLLYLFTYWLFAPIPTETFLSEEEFQRKQSRARTVALVTAGLFCFEETSIFFCGQMLTETLFTFFFVLWAYLTVGAVFRSSLPAATIIGVVGGLAALTRPNFLPVFIAGTYWHFLASRRYFKPPPSDWHRFSLLDSPFAPPFIMVLYACLIISFWSIRNQAVLGEYIPISTNGGVNFYLGHHEDFCYNSFGNKEGIRNSLRAQGSYDEVTESKYFTLLAWKFIHDHPWEDFKNNITKVYHLFLAPVSWRSAVEPWNWFSYLDSPYRPWPWETQRRDLRFWPAFDEQGEKVMPSYNKPFWEEGRLPLVFWGWLLVYLTIGGAVSAFKKYERTAFPVIVIGIYTIVLLFYFANARFRAPLLPFLLPFAGYALVVAVEKIKGLRKRKRDGEQSSESLE